MYKPVTPAVAGGVGGGALLLPETGADSTLLLALATAAVLVVWGALYLKMRNVS